MNWRGEGAARPDSKFAPAMSSVARCLSLWAFLCWLAGIASGAAAAATPPSPPSPALVAAPGTTPSPAVRTVTLTIFWAEGCPHCARALDFLARQQARDPELRVERKEIRRDAAHRRQYFELVRRYGIANPGVPLILVGDTPTVGYYDDRVTGNRLLELVASCRRTPCPDPLAGRTPASVPRDEPAAGPAVDPAAPTSRAPPLANPLPPSLEVPLLGRVATRDLSLPVVTILLGGIDGFNPCAMWTLVFLIGLLLGLRDRLRMWLLGGLFIAGSAVIYLLFMTAWLTTLLALGDVRWLQAAVGGVALAGGGYYLKRFFAHQEVCAVTAPASRRRVVDRLKALALEPNLLLAALGIVALAVVVNLIELVCSAGIPAVYTQLLAFHRLPDWQYAAYLLLYVFVYMLDDLIVFVAAMSTLHLAGLGSNHVRASNLIGGVILLVIGVLMLLRPEWLTFG